VLSQKYVAKVNSSAYQDQRLIQKFVKLQRRKQITNGIRIKIRFKENDR